MKNTDLPKLPLNKWQNTKITLHLILQIIGKVRLKMAPRKNHWWYITQYISPKGITTSPIPYNDGLGTFEILVNVHKPQVEIFTNKGEEEIIPLQDGLIVSEIYNSIISSLGKLGIYPKMLDKPFDLGIEKKFSEIAEFHHFDMEYIHKFWTIMLWCSNVMKEFSGKFYGKTCPVQLYWHHMDLAVTRFSGRKAEELDSSARVSDKDAYSHEAISFGFWAGDDVVKEPAFYAYTYPSPEGIDKEPLKPEKAAWIDSNGSPMAFLRYEDLLSEEDPKKALLDFFESSYLAGAKLANWNIEEFKVKALDEL